MLIFITRKQSDKDLLIKNKTKEEREESCKQLKRASFVKKKMSLFTKLQTLIKIAIINLKHWKLVETEEFSENSGALRRRQESVNPAEQLCCRELAREDFHPINLELCISFPRLSLNPGVGVGLYARPLYIRGRKLSFLLLFVAE